MAPCDYRKYPPNWKSIRLAILARAGDRCEVCKAPNHATIVRNRWDDHDWSEVEGIEADTAKLDGEWVTYIVLTVAHLNHDVMDNRPENLKALCQLHHLRHDKEHHQMNRRETAKKNRTAPLFEDSRI